jgi:DNA-binding CsgD family transcriptional regulator
MTIVSKDKLPFESALSTLEDSRHLYFLCERSTGAAHFQFKAGPDRTLPLGEASSFLAIQCMACGRSPEDYIVMEQADENELKGLFEKTEKLLQSGLCLERSVRLTRRERQVLAGLVGALANKDIAVSLNVRVRTVKFHVSSLLSKFHVHSRMELVREVTRGIVGLLETRQCPTTSTQYRSQDISVPLTRMSTRRTERDSKPHKHISPAC